MQLTALISVRLCGTYKLISVGRLIWEAENRQLGGWYSISESISFSSLTFPPSFPPELEASPWSPTLRSPTHQDLFMGWRNGSAGKALPPSLTA